MSLGKAVLYVVIGLVALVVVSAVVSVVFAAIAFLWLVVRLLVFLVLLGVVGFVGYKVFSLLSGLFATGDELESPTSTSPESGGDRISELKNRYANGELSEAEFERQVERELDSRTFDEIDRELQRDRV